VNVIRDDPWTGSGDALPSSASMIGRLQSSFRSGLRDAYVSILSEDIPEELARRLAQLDPETQRIGDESACGPLA